MLSRELKVGNQERYLQSGLKVVVQKRESPMEWWWVRENSGFSPFLGQVWRCCSWYLCWAVHKRGEYHSNIIRQQVRHPPPVDLYLHHQQVILAITELLFTHEDTHEAQREERRQRREGE